MIKFLCTVKYLSCPVSQSTVKKLSNRQQKNYEGFGINTFCKLWNDTVSLKCAREIIFKTTCRSFQTINLSDSKRTVRPEKHYPRVKTNQIEKLYQTAWNYPPEYFIQLQTHFQTAPDYHALENYQPRN